MTTAKTIAILTAQGAILSCCLTLSAFSQQASQPDKSPSMPSGQNTPPSNASCDSKSHAIEHDGIYELGGGVSAPKLIHVAEAEYAEAARRAHVQGLCVLSVIVGVDGKP